jgi:thiol-disulfide isomerase/thioredoxin
MNSLLTLLFASILAFPAISAPTNAIHVTADIDGIGDGKIFYEYVNLTTLESSRRDSLNAAGGHFELSIPAEAAVIVNFYPKIGMVIRSTGSLFLPPAKMLTLFLRPQEQVVVRGALKSDVLDYETEGSELSEDFRRVRSEYLTAAVEFGDLEMRIDSLRSDKAGPEVIEQQFKERNKRGALISKAKLDYALKHPDKDLSAYLIATQKLETFSENYDRLEDRVKNGLFKAMLNDTMSTYQKYRRTMEAKSLIREGRPAPDFTLKGLNGEAISLSQIKDKIIVLDFWGSWCGHSLASFPRTIAYYEKYKSGLEIIGVACKDDPAAWKNAVNQYKLTWIHVANDVELDRNVAVKYAVEAYPTRIILDRNKTILAVFQGNDDKFYDKLDELMKK